MGPQGDLNSLSAALVTGPFRGVIKEGELHLSFTQVTANDDSAQPEKVILAGKRISPPPPKPDLTKVRFGPAVELFNGRDLSRMQGIQGPGAIFGQPRIASA